jgi:apolipoprotein N-acyltransferase
LCGWIAWASERRVVTPLAIAAAFGLAELARASAWPPTPWALLGASELPELLIARADVVGVFGLGMAAAACNALLASLAAPRLRSRRTALEAVGLIGLAVWAWAAPALKATPGPQRALVVAVVQPGVATGRDVTPAARAIALTRATLSEHPDLVVWPEHAYPAYLREDTPAARRVAALSRELGGDLIVGAPHYRYAEPSPHYYASAFLLRDGALVGRHDKTRLVPFAEASYTAGPVVRSLSGEQIGIGALICAELLFADVSRALARTGAQLLANPSNDAWLAPAASEHLLRLARLRAIENHRPLLRATPTGVSALIAADGSVLARSASAGGEVLVGAVHGSDARTLTNRFGDWPLAAAGLAVAAVSLQARARHSTRRKHA